MQSVKNLLFPILLLSISGGSAQQYTDDARDFMVARIAASDNRISDALPMIEKLAAKNPREPVLQYELANLLVQSGKGERAETVLRALTASHPEFPDPHKLLGRLLLAGGSSDPKRVAEALSRLRSAFQLNPDDIASGTAVAQILFSLGQHEDAAKVVLSLLERSPDNRTLNFQYAQVLTKLGRGDESRKYLEKAVEVEPTYAPAVSQLVNIYERSKQWQSAAELLTPLLEVQPLNTELQRQQAYYFLRAGRADTARNILQQLVKVDPEDEKSQFLLAESYSDAGDVIQAEQLYQKLLLRSPNDPELLFSYGLAQMSRQNLAAATKTFTTLLGVSDITPELRRVVTTQIAAIDLQQGDYENAKKRARETLDGTAERPNHQAISIVLTALRKQDRSSEALSFLQPLVQQYPADQVLQARLIELHWRAGDKEKAAALATEQSGKGKQSAVTVAETFASLEQYDRAASIVESLRKKEPEDLDLIFQLASLRERAGNRKGAEELFLKVLESKPDHAPTLNYLGYMWADRGINLERAADMIERAVAQDPRNGAYVDSLGWVYFRLGKLDLAKRHLETATALVPRDATVREHLGDVHAKKGDRVRAIETYREGLALDPDEKEAASLKQKIQALEKSPGR